MQKSISSFELFRPLNNAAKLSPAEVIFFMTDFKLMVAQQSGKGPNLKVVKWW